MICLYIDTSSDYLYSAIINEQKIVAEIKEKYAKDLSVEALPQIIRLFDKSNMTPKDLDKILKLKTITRKDLKEFKNKYDISADF